MAQFGERAMYFKWNEGNASEKPAALAPGEFYHCRDTKEIFFGKAEGGQQRLFMGLGAASQFLSISLEYPDTFSVTGKSGFTGAVSIIRNFEDVLITSSEPEFGNHIFISTNKSVNYSRPNPHQIILKTSLLGNYGTMCVEIYSR